MNAVIPVPDSSGRLPSSVPDLSHFGRVHAGAAQTAAMASLRADANRSEDDAVDGARLMIRDFVEAQARRVQAEYRIDHGKDLPVSEERKGDIARALARGLGLTVHNGVMRSDTYYLPGDLTAPAGAPVREREQRIAAQRTLRVRAVPSTSRRVPTDYVSYGGEASVMRPGQSRFKRADMNVLRKEKQVTWFVTSTMMDWMDEMYTGQSSLSVVAEKATAARRTLEYLYEQVIVNGLAGLDWTGLVDVQGAAYFSQLNYEAAATTLDDIHRDIIIMSQAAQAANQFRGDASDTILAGPRIFQALMKRSNYDAGGFVDGASQLGAILMAQEGPQARIGRVFQSVGVSRIVLAPSLMGFGGANRDGMIWWSGSNPDGLRQIIAQTVAPIRSHSNLAGTETLWAMAGAGVEAPDATDLIKASVQVAS